MVQRRVMMMTDAMLLGHQAAAQLLQKKKEIMTTFPLFHSLPSTHPQLQLIDALLALEHNVARALAAQQLRCIGHFVVYSSCCCCCCSCKKLLLLFVVIRGIHSVINYLSVLCSSTSIGQLRCICACAYTYMCVCVCTCVRACVRACVLACVLAYSLCVRIVCAFHLRVTSECRSCQL